MVYNILIRMEKPTPCKNCGSNDKKFLMKILAYEKHDRDGRPYRITVPQVREECGKCGAFVKFAPQTDELLSEFNQKFAENPIVHNSFFDTSHG